MSEWRDYSLGELINVKHGYAFPGEFITPEATPNVLVTPGNFHIGGGFKQDKFKYFSGNYPVSYLLKEGDIVVTMTDLSQETDTLGFSAKIPNKKGIKFLHNQRIGLLEFISEDADKDFIYWLLRTNEYQGFIVGASSGTSIRHTSPKFIKEYKFKLPSPKEQKAIASVLSSLDDKIDLLHRQNTTLERMAETLFRQWFVEEAQEDWEEVPLDKLVNITSSKRVFYSEYVASGVPFYRSKEIIELHNTGSTNSELFISEARFNEISNKFGAPQENDILLTSVGTLGVPYKVKKSDRFYFKDGNLTWFKDFLGMPSVIIYCWLKSNIGKEQLDSITIGSTQAALTISGLKQITFKVPPIEIIKLAEEKLNAIYNKVDGNQKQIQTLEKLRDNLLPKLMSGEIRISLND